MNMIMKLFIYIALLSVCNAYNVERDRISTQIPDEYHDVGTDNVTNSDVLYDYDDISYGLDDEPLRLKECRKFHPPRYIINGKDAKAKEFPHMALLGFGEENKTEWNCGGTLISTEFVLTAAHCLYSRLFGSLKYIRLGELDVNSTSDDASPQNFKVKKVYDHDKYSPPSMYNDIALVQLDRPVNITKYVKPACLPLKDHIDEIELTVAGWGYTSRRGKKANILQKAHVKSVSKEICSNTYPSGQKRDLIDGILEETQICAGGKNDTCQGDSGGPLQFINEMYGFPEIVGITSIGKFCGESPSIYTRVSKYVPWIESILWPKM